MGVNRLERNQSKGPQRSTYDTEFLKFFLFDVLLATIVGFVSWLVTRDHISSLVISLVTGAILLLVELRFQLVKTKDDLVESMGLQRAGLEDPTLRSALRRLVTAYQGANARGDPKLSHHARALLADVTNDMAQLQEGVLEIPQGSMYEWSLALMREAQHGVQAHALVEAHDFWLRGAGKQYVEENLTAARRGVKLSRVFTLDSTDELRPENLGLIQAQLEAGIEVRVAFTKSLARELLVDYAIFDDKYVMYWNLVPGTKEVRSGRLVATETEVRRARALHERVMNEAEPAAAFIARLGLSLPVARTPGPAAAKEAVPSSPRRDSP